MANEKTLPVTASWLRKAAAEMSAQAGEYRQRENGRWSEGEEMLLDVARFLRTSAHGMSSRKGKRDGM